MLAVLLLAAVGCADHRIPLKEFLGMQQTACRAPASQPAATEPTTVPAVERSFGAYKVGPSDVLLVTVTGPETAGPAQTLKVRVNRHGMISLPIVGEVKVSDMELEDVEQAIRRAYVPNVYRQAVVHVDLISPRLTQVLVIGAVTSPGLVQLPRTERNLLFAIDRAGGVSAAASGMVTLRRLRDPAASVTINLTDPEGLRRAFAMAPLEDGDIVHVHAATPNVIFVGGLVNSPHPQSYPPGVEVTLLQAIAAAGGLRTDVTPREATLIRRLPNGKDVHVKINLDRVICGRDPNITLQPGDILWVPETPLTRLQDWFNRNVFFRAGVAATVTYQVSGVEYLNRRSQQGGGGGGLEDMFDPYGFLRRTSMLQSLGAPPAQP